MENKYGEKKKLVLSILRARDTVAPKAGGKIG